MNDQPIAGNDVVGQPGQNLSTEELKVLVMLADGEKPSDIASAVGVDRFGLRHIEGSIQAKLGAKSKPHMIARGFVLDVLAPRALCLLLALLSIGAFPDGNSTRAPRRGRTPVTATRTSRTHKASNDGCGPLPLASLYASVS